VWVGELYLELHQGTLTSQALIKKQNRLCEVQLCALEALHVLLIICGARNWLSEEQMRYCSELRTEVVRLWKDTLLNQFHDVLRK
jgi:alpha-mannosidase